jgi:hypothetical protein
MDYIKTEEKLIHAQQQINDELKHIELLSKIDKHIAKYEGDKTIEKLSVTLKLPESLSLTSKLTLPLRIKGKMLGVGRHKIYENNKPGKFYLEEDLKWGVEFHKNKKIPVKLDHEHLKVGSMVGGIDNLYWDDKEKVIRYEAHINDETQARNILDGLITDVSATIYSKPEKHDLYGVVGKMPEFSELSLVVGGAFKGNTIEVVN